MIEIARWILINKKMLHVQKKIVRMSSDKFSLNFVTKKNKFKTVHQNSSHQHLIIFPTFFHVQSALFFTKCLRLKVRCSKSTLFLGLLKQEINWVGSTNLITFSLFCIFHMGNFPIILNSTKHN